MKRRKHKKRRIWLIVIAVIAALAAFVAVGIILFRTRSFEVEGNSYYGENTITTWIQNDRFSVNTLYIMAKYNLTNADLPSGVEKMKISLKNPWTVKVTVTEKEMAGYVDYEGSYLYFDDSGIVSLRSSKLIEGTPYIENLAFNTAKVELGKKLPVEDDTIFGKIVEVSKNLKKYELIPDKMACADGSIQIYFGVVEVLLGRGNYEEKLQQVPPILSKLAELYPDTAGTLHLENYDPEAESIRFVPAG